MVRRQKYPDGRPSILDRPFFNAAKQDFTQRSLTVRGDDTSPKHEKILGTQPVCYDSATKKTTLPALKQPYRLVRPKMNKPNPDDQDIHVSQDPPRRRHHGIITITFPHPPRGSKPAPVNLPVPIDSHSHGPSHHPHRRNASPLPPSKIRALKNTYETLNPDIPIDHHKQIRLSRALSFHGHVQNSLIQLVTLSQLPFANEGDISSSGVLMSCFDGRMERETRLIEVEARRNMLRAARRGGRWAEEEEDEEGRAYIVRCGEKGSGSAILVGWKGRVGEKDRYALYFEGDVMPREVRYLVLQVWGVPFGYEGRDWDVDMDGRLWVRERPHRDNRWGRWWTLQG